MREQMEIPMTKLNRIALIVLISAAAVMGAAVTTGAMAAPKQLCKDYARSVVQQSTKMQALNRGCTGFRWHNWYDGHYGWCRKASKDAAFHEYLVRRNTIVNNGPC
jgi:hypothetical protein